MRIYCYKINIEFFLNFVKSIRSCAHWGNFENFKDYNPDMFKLLNTCDRGNVDALQDLSVWIRDCNKTTALTAAGTFRVIRTEHSSLKLKSHLIDNKHMLLLIKVIALSEMKDLLFF